MCKGVKLLRGLPSYLMLVLLCIWFDFLPTAWSYDYQEDDMAPVILVPGVVGSQIEGRWKTQNHPEFCSEESDWQLMWINLKTVRGGNSLKCWVYRYQLIYDREKHRSRNQDGVETRVLGEFGSLEPVESLTSDLITQVSTGYFDNIKKSLLKSGYYTFNNLKAAPYDGRYAPPQLTELGYLSSMKGLVEQVAAESGRKVAIVAHSMGGLVAAYFLANQSQDWKDQHIHAFIPISTPWLGSPMSVSAFIQGSNFGVPTFKRSVMRELVRTFQSTALLLPDEEAYKNTVLVDWPEKKKKYTARDYKQLFTDIEYEDGYLIREDVRLNMPLVAEKLGVKTFCIWSKAVETQFKMTIKGDIRDPTSVKYSNVDGDGTVALTSLRYCEQFPRVKVKEYQKLDHLKIVASDKVIEYIKSILRKPVPWYHPWRHLPRVPGKGKIDITWDNGKGKISWKHRKKDSLKSRLSKRVSSPIRTIKKALSPR